MLRRFAPSWRSVLAAAVPRRMAASATPTTGAAASSPAAAPTAAATKAAAAAAATTKAAAAASDAADRKPSPNDFAKILGDRVTETIPCGAHTRVYVDTKMFAWIVMDRDGSSANALGEAFVGSLAVAFDTVDRLVKEKKARIAILTSAKEAFCVGADLEQMYPVTDRAVAEKASRELQKFLIRIESTTYPVIAAINGLALGGGCELSLACHHRLVASAKGQMGLPETLLGLLPGGGGTVRLPRLVGTQTALKWILQGASQKADRCKKAGAADAVIESVDRFANENRFFEGVRSWAGKLIDRPLKPAKGKAKGIVDRLLEDTPIGRKIIVNQSLKTLDKLTKGKYFGQYLALESVIHGTACGNRDKAFEREARLFSELLVMPEAKNQIALYFLDDGMKKVEKKTGVPAKSIPYPKGVGVIGAGVMGAGIVHHFAKKDIPVAVLDVDAARVDKGIDLVRADFAAAVKKKKLSQQDMDKKMKRVIGGTQDEIFKGVDIIVEAAVEVMEIKKRIVKDLEAKGILDGKRLFATNTSSLSLTELQAISKHPGCIVGMHFFNPVSKMPLVEVIKGKQTSKEAAAIIYNLALKTGKKPIIVGDAPGFLVNRVLGVYMAEAGRLAIHDRADPIRIDKVITQFGLPMGPFRLLDEVGIDVACHVGPVLKNGLKSDRFGVDHQIELLLKDGFLGKKNRKGFYRYDDTGKDRGMDVATTSKYLNSNPDSTFSAGDILDRCILLMVNEATLILSEGIAASPEDVDTGMVWGTGFPPYRGGLLQYADHRGVQAVVDRLSQLQDKCKDERFAPSPMLKEMAKGGKRFFPNRPFVPYVERTGSPKVNL